ncbi:cupin domain-containing protein [Luminiphilus syltensis]|uniref:cupin domain-containing protein n=1 Tax=Luminiphilus syltensis TaxID=1341119 RepID=UPI00058B05A9|nr:hypothetical protein [Luminiphilus syltensis]
METIATVLGPVAKANSSEGEWDTFVDPGENPGFFEKMTETIKVKFMGENWEKGPWIVANLFPPNVKAGEHSHNFDTVYLITKGSLNFNDGLGWFSPGDVRWVRAGTIYGPEEAGPEGCEFILISQGPIEVAWKDGEVYNAGD